jgi:2-polyprenyl-3-methyl-5-hydroxy-6-metoxy-1,4-benzoquinol methylase
LTRPELAEHNRIQRAHFAGGPERNRRMRPVDSAYVARHVDRVVDFAGLAGGERILEVGCGMGKFTWPLAARGFDVEGLDLSAELLAAAPPALGEAGVVLHHGDLLDAAPSLRGRFDVVAGFFTLHHLLDLPEAFAAMRAYLRPGGRVVFVEPNGHNPLYYLQITLTPGMSWRSDKGVVGMTARHLAQCLRRAGLTDVRTEQAGLFPPGLVNRARGRAAEDRLQALTAIGPVAAFQLVTATSPGPVVS